ncbi:hypothetical protein GWK47_001566 [Chionoecetes opilio]|uniref:No apical meristem-associated C-terminal domain-containing protein n=1 Tax=Chionoecetes opilio TaxID=41210 RepID=A0A8J4XVP1_CHIOP|nr:hypothetical protein GWK47_001566 [Chionoecetes opilio]
MTKFSRAKKDYTHQKAERAKTGGGPPPAPVDPVSAAVLPLLEDELEPLHNTFDYDQTYHDQAVTEDADDGSMTLPEPFLQETSNSAGVTYTVTCNIDDDDDGPIETSNATTATPIRQGPAIKKRKLSTEKEEALRLTAERSQLLRTMDMEVHQKRLELLEHEKMLKTEQLEQEKMLKTEHFRSLQELQDLQKKCLLEYHEKIMARLQ